MALLTRNMADVRQMLWYRPHARGTGYMVSPSIMKVLEYLKFFSSVDAKDNHDESQNESVLRMKVIAQAQVHDRWSQIDSMDLFIQMSKIAGGPPTLKVHLREPNPWLPMIETGLNHASTITT